MQNAPSSRRFPQLFSGLLALSLALLGGSFVAAGAIRNLKQADDTLEVTGSAKRPIRSDYTIWRVSVSSEQPTAQAAYQELKNHTERLRRYLKEKQIPDDAIALGSIDASKVPEVINGRETGKILANRFNQRFEIRSSDVNRITQLSQQVTELINEGIPIASESPEYLYTQLSKLRVEMVAEATKDAKARAEAIARSTGNKVGRIRKAKTGVFQITSPNSTAVSDSGVFDTSSINKDITAVVSVEFGVE
ncbi:MAG: SIMPL domain-containing protein [Scytonematopsis contorta HA4267-MV1]|jgi:hypothetical protein|nr:SIMPL domain-containing protein [Scytonematopsis contorta HA4267-MV1]